MASLMLSTFIMITAIRSQTILSGRSADYGMCASDNATLAQLDSPFAFLALVEECPVQETQTLPTSLLKTQDKTSEVKKPQIKIRTMRNNSQTNAHKIKVIKELQKSRAKARQIKVAKVSQNSETNSSHVSARQIKVAKLPQKAASKARQIKVRSNSISPMDMSQHVTAQLEDLSADVPKTEAASRPPTMAQLLSQRPPLLVKQRMVQAPVFARPIAEEWDEVMPLHPVEGAQEEPLPCTDNYDDLEEPMPWHPQECAEVLAQPTAEAERSRKLKFQPIVEEEVPEIVFGPEQQPKKGSLRLLPASSSDVQLKETVKSDVLWEVYNEPVESYWEQEDRESQEFDKADLPEILKVLPHVEAAVNVDQGSSRSIAEVMESSMSANGALAFFAFFLSLAVWIQNAMNARYDKSQDSYSKIQEAQLDELMRSAAVGSAWRKSHNAVDMLV